MSTQPVTLEQLSEFAYGFWESRIFLSAVELDLFTALGDNDLTSAEVADQLELDHRATDIMLHALAAMGFLEVDGERFRNTPVAREHLVAGKPGYMGVALRHSANLWHRWSGLTQTVRTGEPVDIAMPGDSGDWTENFIMAMHKRALIRAPKVADELKLMGVKRLLDLGGGPGTHSIVFAERVPQLQAVVFDLPDVIPIAERIIRESGVADRVTTRAGDYHVDDYGKNFDMIFLSAIIHSNSPEENTALFRKAYEALEPGGRIAIVDFILNNDKTEPRFGAVFAVNMLVATRSGNCYSYQEIKSWLEAAGYEDISSPVEVDEDISLVTARKSDKL